MLGFYLLVFFSLLIAPFAFFLVRFEENTSPFGWNSEENFSQERERLRNLLDSLKDFQSDLASGKITELEFLEASKPLLEEMESIKQAPKIQTMETSLPISWTCKNCQTLVQLASAKFCPECGFAKSS